MTRAPLYKHAALGGEQQGRQYLAAQQAWNPQWGTAHPGTALQSSPWQWPCTPQSYRCPPRSLQEQPGCTPQAGMGPVPLCLNIQKRKRLESKRVWLHQSRMRASSDTWALVSGSCMQRSAFLCGLSRWSFIHVKCMLGMMQKGFMTGSIAHQDMY